MGRRSPVVGGVVAVGSLAVTTALLYPLEQIASPVSLGVLYLLAVLLVSSLWGLWLGLATSVGAALCFNFFHIPPTGQFTIARPRTGSRWRCSSSPRLLLGTPEPRTALGSASKRIADALEIDSASVVLDRVAGDERRAAVPLGSHGTLLVPTAAADVARERVAPALEALLAAALEREQLTREVVETDALRPSDEIKTAVLRSVSHDLRSPLTATVAAGEALSPLSLSESDRAERGDTIAHESARLTRLVDQRRVAPRAGHVVRRRAAAAGGRAGAGMRRVLVLDDEPQILRALRVVLREAGFEAIPAETAEEALDRASIRPPDAAIVDLVLPDGDGVAVTRELRRSAQRLGADLDVLIVLAREASDAEREQIEAFHRLGSLLGARVLVEDGDDVVEVAARVARERRSTYVLIGTPGPRTGLARLRAPLTERLLRALPGVDVRIVADRTKREWSKR